MILADFHIHSNYSDGKHSIAEIVDYYGTRGFGAIAITDHVCESSTLWGKAAAYLGNTLTEATFPAYLAELKKEAERAWSQYKMVLIPGIELTKNTFSNHRSAHVLALNLSSYIAADDPIETLLKKIRSQGALSIAAHPVSTRKIEKQALHLWDRRLELAPHFDAWEVASGPHLFDEVLASGLPIIANSDLHRFSQMTSWKTILNCEKHPEAILDAIRRQNLSPYFFTDSNRAPSSLARPVSLSLNFCPESASKTA